MGNELTFNRVEGLLNGINGHNDEMIKYYKVKLKTPTLDDFFKKSLKDCEKRKKLISKLIKKLNKDNFEKIYDELKEHEMV